MNENEVLQTDYYASRLAEVNEKNEVVSTEDIVNGNGVLLCRKGMSINRKIADQIVRHKLVKPLEEQVKITDSLDNKSLYGGMHRDILARYPDLEQLLFDLNFSYEYKNICMGQKVHPILIQKMTVINDRLRRELEKGIFCSCLSALIAKELGFDEEEIRHAFITGLVHDVGLIHLSPDVLNKKEALTPAERRTIQSHVVVGKMVQENIQQLDKHTSRAVLEHHERCDGSGYPLGKTGRHLDTLGQIIGLSDSIYAIRINRFAQKGYTLGNMLPYLKMNTGTYCHDVCGAMLSIVEKSELKPAADLRENVEALAEQLHRKGRILRQTGDVLAKDDLPELLGPVYDNPEETPLYKVIDNYLSLTARSGIDSDVLLAWLPVLRKDRDPALLGELIEMEIVQNEFLWKLQNIVNMIGAILAEENTVDAAGKSVLEEMAGGLSSSLAGLRQDN